MDISVIGTGYVGLVVGTCLSGSGNNVSCVDVNTNRVSALNSGEVQIYEPGLAELVRSGLKNHRLSFTSDISESIKSRDVIFVSVGTPSGPDGRTADIHVLLEVSKQIGKLIHKYVVIVNKSTAPVGTCERMRSEIAKGTNVEFDVVANPEFLKEGAAVEDFLRPDRVVIGTDSERARKVMSEIYAPFLRTGHPILFMEPRAAELTKYAANAMLAMRISFMNDIAMLCEKVGADVESVRHGVGSDRRIGTSFLFPGVGFGGSCFPKDIRALAAMGREHGLDFDLLRAVECVNERHKRLLLVKAQHHFGELSDKRFAVWGLAFKPRTDDMREAPSIAIIEGLLSGGAKVCAYDPAAGEAARRLFGSRVEFGESPYQALEGVDALFIVTEWSDFRHPDFEHMKSIMRSPVIFDGRNIYYSSDMHQRGFIYYGVGS